MNDNAWLQTVSTFSSVFKKKEEKKKKEKQSRWEMGKSQQLHSSFKEGLELIILKSTCFRDISGSLWPLTTILHLKYWKW